MAGAEAAMLLAGAYGGIEVYIPQRPNLDHWLSKTVGYEAAVKIAEWLPGLRVRIPIGGRGLTLDQVQSAFREHGSARRVARALGVTQRTVHRWRAKLREAALASIDLGKLDR